MTIKNREERKVYDGDYGPLSRKHEKVTENWICWERVIVSVVLITIVVMITAKGEVTLAPLGDIGLSLVMWAGLLSATTSWRANVHVTEIWDDEEETHSTYERPYIGRFWAFAISAGLAIVYLLLN